jgi:hypothetical protein
LKRELHCKTKQNKNSYARIETMGVEGKKEEMREYARK